MYRKVYGYIIQSTRLVGERSLYKLDLACRGIHGHYELVAYVDNLTNNDAAIYRPALPPIDYAYRLRRRPVGFDTQSILLAVSCFNER